MLLAIPTLANDGSDCFRPYVEGEPIIRAVVALCAANPDLAQKLVRTFPCQEGPGEVSALFHNLFVTAASEAVGTKNNNFASLRLRGAQEIDAALRALHRNGVGHATE